MSALSVRLDKLAARMPPPPVAAPAARGSLKADLERIMAQTAFLKTATPLQRYKFYADDIARLERRLLEDDPREGLAATLAKVRRVTFPSFIEDARQELAKAERDLLAAEGFTDPNTPEARKRLALLTFAL
jgi:hypothetical protein